MAEQKWFPGLEPRPQRRPGKIRVERAEPITIEEKEGIRDDTERMARKDVSNINRGGDVPRIIQMDTPAQHAEKEPPPIAQVDPKPRRANLWIIKISSAFLASLAALMSWYYSFEWFRDKLPGVWRFMLPVIIVGCSVLLPEVSLLLLNRKGWKPKLAAPLVFSIGLLASGFSMLSTVAGIYNANSASINRQAESIIESNEYALAREEVGRIDTEIARLNKEIDSTQEKVDGIATEDTQRGDSQALMRRLNNAKREKQTYEKERKAINDRLAEIRKAGHTSEVVREDFNTFLGRQFKTEPGRVEFGMAAAPAILLDVVAPILSAVALFL
jgi:hypothetical protein